MQLTSKWKIFNAVFKVMKELSLMKADDEVCNVLK